MMLPRISAVLLFSRVSAVDWSQVCVGQQQTFGSQRLCPVGQQAWVPGHGFFLGVLDFVNGGADTVLWYCSVLF